MQEYVYRSLGEYLNSLEKQVTALPDWPVRLHFGAAMFDVTNDGHHSSRTYWLRFAQNFPQGSQLKNVTDVKDSERGCQFLT